MTVYGQIGTLYLYNCFWASHSTYWLAIFIIIKH